MKILEIFKKLFNRKKSNFPKQNRYFGSTTTITSYLPDSYIYDGNTWLKNEDNSGYHNSKL